VRAAEGFGTAEDYSVP